MAEQAHRWGLPGPDRTPGPPPDLQHRSRVLHVDCDTCAVRGAACRGCVVAVLLGPPGDLDLDADEQAALSTLASSGLVPPLRLVESVSGPRLPAPGGDDGDGWDDGWGEPSEDWL